MFATTYKTGCPLAREAVECLVNLLPVQTGAKQVTYKHLIRYFFAVR